MVVLSLETSVLLDHRPEVSHGTSRRCLGKRMTHRCIEAHPASTEEGASIHRTAIDADPTTCGELTNGLFAIHRNAKATGKTIA